MPLARVSPHQQQRQQQEWFAVPSGLNWLNVPATVNTSIAALDGEAQRTRRDVDDLDAYMEALEERLGALERQNRRLVQLVEDQRATIDHLSRQLSSVQQTTSLETILEHVSARLFSRPEDLVPEEIRLVLQRLEQAAPRLNARLSALEQQQRAPPPAVRRLSQAATELKKLAL